MPADVHVAALAKLAHPARLRILRRLRAAPGGIGADIAGAVGLARSAVPEHLCILEAAPVITGEIDGPRVRYPLNPAALAHLIAGLTPPRNGVFLVPAGKESA